MEDESPDEDTIVDPVEHAEKTFDVIESSLEKLHDIERGRLLYESWKIFNNAGVEEKAAEITYLAGLQRRPSFIPGLEPHDPWEWALGHFMEPFPFINEEVCNFFKERRKNAPHPLAIARYTYAICTHDESARSEGLEKAGSLFIEVGTDALLRDVERLEAIATAKEMRLGISILKLSGYDKQASEAINQILDIIQSHSSPETLPSIVAYVKELSNYIEFASEDKVLKTIEVILKATEQAEGNWKHHGLESLLEWKGGYLAEEHKKIHFRLASVYSEMAKDREPAGAAHFYRDAALHAVNANENELAGELLAKAEKSQSEIKMLPIIARYQIPQEELEKYYDGVAEDIRGIHLLLRLSLVSLRNMNEPLPTSVLRQIMPTVKLQGQTSVEVPTEEETIDTWVRQGAFATQTFWTGINYYLSKDWLREEDVYMAFHAYGFERTIPFIYEAQLAVKYDMTHSALHIIVPTIERFFQEILSLAGQPSTFIDPNGTTQVPSLSRLLLRLKDIGVISEIELNFISAQLDKDGRNIRNMVCHGLIGYHDSVDFDYRLCLMLLIFVLAKWHVWKFERENSKAKEGNGG